MKKSVFGLILVAVMLRVLPSVAQSESVVTLSGNAYVTAVSEDEAQKAVFIDEYRSALRHWDSKDEVVSFYFKTEKVGRMRVALQAKGHSKIEVSLLGKKEEGEA